MSAVTTEEIERAKAVLVSMDLVWGVDEDSPDGDQILNMNDTWGWATAWGERVPDEELPEAARLAIKYGYCGVLYWVSQRHDQMKSEFEDINRMVAFVRAEESIRAEYPNSSERAYLKRSYTL